MRKVDESGEVREERRDGVQIMCMRKDCVINKILNMGVIKMLHNSYALTQLLHLMSSNLSVNSTVININTQRTK